MLRRLSAILFILALAGQIYAGVCGCMGGESEAAHACCKPKTAVENSMQGKACCETVCAMSHSENTVPDRLETIAKITFQASEPPTVPTFAFAPRSVVRTSNTPTRVLLDAAHVRPPELYLRHRAFLI
ncbi:MAG: hypothetical protein DYH05_07840 [Acidobacteria bacterium ACB1]|nr:hypothetical protein [Pyrinomonadaceae bacterium]MCE7962396.1 hypothetical protein [Acidobacteria bacterium ACB1]RIJ95702.1 MAG: hypothetical protein DCC44_01995 [Acidobacteriota bacterium]